MAKEILIKFENDKDYDLFVEEIIKDQDDVEFDQENNILIVKDLENGSSN